MAANSFAYEIKSVIIAKISALSAGIPTKGDLIQTIDITPQIKEIDTYQSIFTQYMKADITVSDPIGLFVNFPLSGEEAVFVTFKDVAANKTYTYPFVIDTVSDISVNDKAREVYYVIRCVAIEAYANAKQSVQQAYSDTAANIIKKIFDEHIVQRTTKLVPGYTPLPLIVDNNDSLEGTVVIPNMLPFAAIKMMAEIYVHNTPGKDACLFFQTPRNFKFTTLQSLFDVSTRANARRNARNKGYKYISNEITEDYAEMENEGRLATRLVYNKRYSSLDKIALGYFQNTLFEINIGQKAFWAEQRELKDLPTIYPHKLNTEAYQQATIVSDADDEQSNRTRYVVNIHRENDKQFPVSRQRQKWGAELQSLIALSQIDITVVIPGTSEFLAGDLFYLEIPEVHGFNELRQDDLVSGLFVITEVKHTLIRGGFHSTVLRLNKDSYATSIDRGSRYA